MPVESVGFNEKQIYFPAINKLRKTNCWLHTQMSTILWLYIVSNTAETKCYQTVFPLILMCIFTSKQISSRLYQGKYEMSVKMIL